MKKETNGPVLRSLPAGAGAIFHSPTTSPFAASTSFGFTSQSSTVFHHHHDHYHRPSASPHSVRFSMDHRPGSSTRSITDSNRSSPVSQRKRACTCSPTTHPGSFRCSLHKSSSSGGQHRASSLSAYSSRRLNMRRSAMTNSLVRIGGVEGDRVKRALTALIRPSSHHLRRRANFRPRPTRLSAMSNAENLRVTWDDLTVEGPEKPLKWRREAFYSKGRGRIKKLL